jgi:hypothetical protein
MITPAWDTSAHGDGADTRPAEMSTLGEHRVQCTARSGRWVTMRCAAGQVLGFVSTRLVTTTALVMCLVLAWLVWV